MTGPLSQEIHVWRVDLTAGQTALAAADALLCDDERAWAARGVAEVAARRTLRRAALRRVLASYLDTAPGALRFTHGPDGKPALVSGDGPQFNASSTGDLALVAVTAAGPVGVDVERLRPVEHLDRLTRRFAPEVAARIAGDDPERLRAFFAAWTRSEAYTKAVGQGLSMPLDRFAVSVDDDERPPMLAIDGDDPAAWQLLSFAPDDGHAAAVAVRAGTGAAPLTLHRFATRTFGQENWAPTR